MQVLTKICKQCNQELPLSDFHNRKDGKYGVRARCKECEKYLRSNVWDFNVVETDRKRIEKRKNLYINEWYSKNKHLTKVCSKCNKEKLINEFRDDILGLYGKYSICRECVSIYSEKYCKENREVLNERHRNYYHRVLKYSTQHKISQSISNGMRESLNSDKQGRHWEDLVGYVLQDLINHLEVQFDETMNWDNYGKYWEIDHIIPVSAYQFNSVHDEDFKRCWSLKNLRPLNRVENGRKNNKIYINDDMYDLLPQGVI